MPRLTADDDDTVLACPDCDTSSVYIRMSDDVEDTLACYAGDCDWTGEQCIARAPLEGMTAGGPNPGEPGHVLVEMSPAEFEREVLRG